MAAACRAGARCALHDQQRRRVVQLGQQRRVEPLAEEQVARASASTAHDLLLDVAPADQSRRSAAATRREIGHGIERRPRAAEAGEQLAIGDGPDVRANGPAGAGRPGRPTSARSLFRPSVRSRPAGARCWSRCFQTTSKRERRGASESESIAQNGRATGARAPPSSPPPRRCGIRPAGRARRPRRRPRSNRQQRRSGRRARSRRPCRP